jgi:hypothetical protein
MSDLEIARLDPFDPVAFDAWYAAYLAAEQAGGDGVAAPLMLEEVRALLQDAGTRRWASGWTGTVYGRVRRHRAGRPRVRPEPRLRVGAG